MTPSPFQEAQNLIADSKNILLVAHAKMDGDTLSATIAMHRLLQKLSKKTTVVCADAVPEIFSFLPETGIIERNIEGGNEFVITLNCAEKKAKKLRWQTEGNVLKIFITPESVLFSEKDVRFSQKSDFDLIISLDAADRYQLGSIFEENPDLFTRVPLLVFDHHASNPGFGTVNVIDTKAASTTEVLFHFLPFVLGEHWKQQIDPDTATLLLTGIITDTGSFQNPNTTPRSLEVAADLVDMGARQQEIIRHIFKTKDISTLRLWGRVLSKIKTDPVHRLLWSVVSVDDLEDTGGKMEDTESIIDELLATAPGMEMVILIKERRDGVIATSLRSTTPLCDTSEFAAEFGGGGHVQAAGFKIRGKKPFDVVVGEVIASAQTFQANRLHLNESQHFFKKEDSAAALPSSMQNLEESSPPNIAPPIVLESASPHPAPSKVMEKNSPKTFSHVPPENDSSPLPSSNAHSDSPPPESSPPDISSEKEKKPFNHKKKKTDKVSMGRFQDPPKMENVPEYIPEKREEKTDVDTGKQHSSSEASLPPSPQKGNISFQDAFTLKEKESPKVDSEEPDESDAALDITEKDIPSWIKAPVRDNVSSDSQEKNDTPLSRQEFSEMLSETISPSRTHEGVPVSRERKNMPEKEMPPFSGPESFSERDIPEWMRAPSSRPHSDLERDLHPRTPVAREQFSEMLDETIAAVSAKKEAPDTPENNEDLPSL